MSEYNRPPAGSVDASRFAPADKGVTGGDGHDHAGGRGGTISWSALGGVPAAFPPSAHGHGLDDVAGLRSALDGKEPAIGSKGSAFNRSFGASAGMVCAGDDPRLNDARAPLAHGHAVAEIATLQSALDAKAGVGHGHAVADVAGLQTALDGKAAASHNHDALYAALAHVGAGGGAHALATTLAAGFMSAADKTKLDGMLIDEVGAWTPSLYGQTAAGTVTASAGGVYWRVGRLVWITGAMTVTTVSGMSGPLWMGGLPFALAPVGAGGTNTPVTTICYGASGVTAGYGVFVHLSAGAANGAVHSYGVNGTLVQLTAANVVAGFVIRVAGCYAKTA